MAAPVVSRRDVLRWRFRRHQLHRPPGSADGATDVDLLDYGVQDTGPDGSAWALRIRGVDNPVFDDLALAWTLRGAPHAYRRAELAQVAVATAPFSEVDAAKRMFDAVRPLKAAGTPALEALQVVADHLRAIVSKPTVKGEASGRLTEVVDPPYLRACRPCATTHVYEMPFRLAALQAGLDLEPGTSPPVLRRVKGLVPLRFEHLAAEADARHDVLRNHLRFYGPARPADVPPSSTPRPRT
ncbi:MAG: crosslink repair DNA glycosylase YcaQ family protein [Acidimicrobiales bacterium]